MDVSAYDHPERVQLRNARENIERDYRSGVIDRARYLMEMQHMDDGERYLNARMKRRN